VESGFPHGSNAYEMAAHSNSMKGTGVQPDSIFWPWIVLTEHDRHFKVTGSIATTG
jgi:hypothetical protein